MKKLFKVMLVIALLCTSFMSNVNFVHSQEQIPCTQLSSSNMDAQDYQNNRYVYWANPIYSFLEKTSNGWMRLIYSSSVEGYLVDYFDNNFNETKRIVVPKELPIFGGFHASDDAYFIVTGQTNEEENNSKEVIRVSKYDKQWNFVKSIALSNINTSTPFKGGSLRMDDDGTYLMIRTAHEMYKSSDGLNHQSNMTFQIKMNDMTLSDSLAVLSNTNRGYVSHSFNQFIKIDGTSLVTLDHGDAYPRSFVMMQYNTNYTDGKFTSNNGGTIKNVDVYKFAGQIGNNVTGASAGGLEVSDTHYLMVASTFPQDGNTSYKTANVLVGAVNKTTFESEVLFKTNYEEGEAVVSTPQLVKVNDNRFVVLYEVNQKIHYFIMDGTGATVQDVKTIDGSLSDCQPVVANNILTWYTYNKNETTFYQLNLGSNTCTSKVLNTGHDHGEGGEVINGYTTVTCTRCNEMDTVECITSLYTYWGTAPTGSFTSSVNTKLNVGQSIYSLYDATYASGKDATITDEVVVTLSDSSVMRYEMKGSTGCFTALKDGICKVTIASKYNPSVKKEVIFAVGEGQGVTVLDKVATLKAVTGLEEGSVSLSWDSVAGATAYAVYYKTKGLPSFSLAGTVTWTEIKISKLTAGHTYVFYVVAKNDYCESEPSVQVEVTIKAKVDKTALNEIIAEAEALNEKDYSAESWSVLSSALDAAKTIANNEDATQTEIDDAKTTLQNALNALEARKIPAEITNFKVEQLSNREIRLSWDPCEGATSYDIYEFKQEVDLTKFNLLKTITETSLELNNLHPSHRYRYYIVAKNEFGETKSKTITIEMMLFGKPELSIEQISEGKFKFKWTAVEDATGYTLYTVRKSNNVTFYDFFDQDELEYTTFNLLADEYSFYVKATYNYGGIHNAYEYNYPSNVVEGVSTYDKPIVKAESGYNDVTLTCEHIRGIIYYDVYCKSSEENAEFELVKTVDNDTATITNLTTDSTYTFYVIGRSSSSENMITKPSEEIQIKTKKINKPEKVTNLTYQLGGYSEVILKWDKNDKAKSYEIYCKGYNEDDEYTLVDTVTDSKTRITGLNAEKNYTFYVIAVNESGSSVPSDEIQVITPKVITNFKVEQLNHEELQLTWDKFEGITSYYIYYKSDYLEQENFYTNKYSLYKVDTNSDVFTDFPLIGNLHSFYIVAKDGSNIIASSEVIYITPKIQEKINLTIEKIGGMKFKLSWNDVRGAYGYKIYYKYNDEDYKVFEDTYNYVYYDNEYITEEMPAGNYSFYVVARSYDLEGAVSDPSNIVTGSYVMEKPEIKIYSGNDYFFDNVFITWNEVEGATQYQVYYRNVEKGNDFVRKQTVEGQGTYIYELEKNKTHEFYVVAVNGEASSQPSEIVSITTQNELLDSVKNLKYEQVKYNEVKLTWDKVDGATSYLIYETDYYGRNYKLIDTVVEPTVNIGDLWTGAYFRYTIIPINDDNTCGDANSIRFKTTFVGSSELSVEKASSTTFKFNWTPIDGAYRYCIYYCYNNGLYKELEVITDDVLEYTTEPLPAGEYSFYITGLRNYVEDTVETERSNVVTGVSYFEKPVVTLSSKLNEITVAWNLVEGVTSYDVYLKGYEENAEFVCVDNVEGHKTVISGLDEDKTYTVYIVGKNGELSTEPSDHVQITTKKRPASVTNLQVTQIGAQEVTLTWDLSDDATSYSVYCKGMKGTTSFKLLETVSNNTVDLTDLALGYTYTFYIVAKNEYGSSNPSEQVQITLKKVVDKTALKALIDEVNSWTDTDKYSLGSWKKVTTSLSDATNVYQNAEATQEEVDAAITDLETQISKLVDRSVLKSLIEQAEAILENADKYSEDSVYTLAEKYHSAVFTYETSIYYTQADCDYKADELDKAIKAMKELTDVSIPSTVVNLVAEDTNYKTITLTWNAAENATAYEVYRKAYDSEEFKLYKTVEDTTLAVTGVMTGKEYAFYVVAKNEAGEAEASATVTKATTLHGKVTLDIEKVSTSKFKLSWNKIDGATRYLVYRKRNDDKMKKVLTLSANILEYVTAELPNGDYQFVLKAGRYDSKDRVMTKTSNTVEGIVEKIRPAVTLTVGSKSVNVSWKPMEGVTHYQVYCATSENGKYTKLTTTKELSYTAKSLTSGKKYFFKVRGYKTYKSGTDIKYAVYTPYSTIRYAIVK